jgi:hypothetical protein
MRDDNFWGILSLDMGVENAFRFNNYIGTLLAETVTTGEIYLGMAYPLSAYFLLKRLVDSVRATGDTSCSLTDEDSTMVFHTTLHPPAS